MRILGRKKEESSTGIPTVGIFTGILLYLYLDDFDRKVVPLFYKTGYYSRFLHTAVIASVPQGEINKDSCVY